MVRSHMIDIPHQWLRRAGTPDEFEQAQLERAATAFNLPFEKVAQKFSARPFGEMTARWRDFVRQVGDEYELWFFSSPDDTFAKKLGCQGYAIVRDGIIRETLITLRT
jgi:hypothetical protein